MLKTTYTNFGPTLASEKLRDRNGIVVSRETIRTWLIEEGLWKAQRKKQPRVYQRRARRSRFGELLQGDGSLHDWFEGRSDKCTLVQFVDDATGRITVARFVSSETTEAYLYLLKAHLEAYGRLSIEQALWEGSLWSPSYFAGACDGAPLTLIKQFIENQDKPST